tara:strand:- start:212 stop:340 length:129 start_codon:yes stop_codon:yes gene_type:complete
MIDFSLGGAGNAILWVTGGIVAVTLIQPFADQLENAIKGNGA